LYNKYHYIHHKYCIEITNAAFGPVNRSLACLSKAYRTRHHSYSNCCTCVQVSAVKSEETQQPSLVLQVGLSGSQILGQLSSYDILVCKTHAHSDLHFG